MEMVHLQRFGLSGNNMEIFVQETCKYDVKTCKCSQWSGKIM